MSRIDQHLERIDPVEAWRPWQPSSADPWSPKWAAHLYRRAGFGPNQEDLLEAGRLGPEGTLDLLLNGRPQAKEITQTLMDLGRQVVDRDEDGEPLRGWWLYCMLQGGHPLREKMTLFWHNHFATSIAKVLSPRLMFEQNCLLRRHALLRFGPLLQEISRDSAMLIWLDSNSNVKGKPNENYARELMELFSLGVGNYTEGDIREAARAFTGWRTDGRGFTFDARLHDFEPKRVLGQTGVWDGGDVVRIILGRPHTARFLVRKLYYFLVSEQSVPPDSLLEPLCELFRKSDCDIAVLVRTILGSRHFYSAHAFRRRIKSPVEYVLGAVRTAYRQFGETEADYRPLPQQVLVSRLNAMGQALFAPPNVKGWPGGPAWLNTSTVLERDNFAGALALGTLWTSLSPEPPAVTAAAAQFREQSNSRSGKSREIPDLPEEPAPPRAWDAARVALEEELTKPGVFPQQPEEVAARLLDAYLPGGVRPEVRSRLVAYLADGNPGGPTLARRVREAVHAILSMAEYQLA